MVSLRIGGENSPENGYKVAESGENSPPGNCR